MAKKDDDFTNGDPFNLFNVRLSYPNLYEPKKFKDGSGKPKFQATLLVPKSDKVSSDTLFAEAEKVIPGYNINMKLARHCILDGDEPRKINEPVAEELKGMWVVRLSAIESRPPVLMTAGLERVLNKNNDPFFPGCYVNARLSLTFMDSVAYSQMLNGTINGLQFDHGTVDDKLTGGMSEEEATDGFTVVNNQVFVQGIDGAREGRDAPVGDVNAGEAPPIGQNLKTK